MDWPLESEFMQRPEESESLSEMLNIEFKAQGQRVKELEKKLEQQERLTKYDELTCKMRAEVDIKSFKMTQFVPLSLRVFHAGSTFGEWYTRIQKFWNSNPVPEDIIVAKALESMETYEKEFAIQLRSQNIISFERLESELYSYGSLEN